MEFLEGIEQLGAVRLLKTSFVAYPIVNALHIAVIGMLLTSVVLLDLAVLGAIRSLPRKEFVALFRRVAFTQAPLGPLHDSARRIAGATLNDAVLASVAGGLRHWIEEHHGRLGDLRVKVPVSLHDEGDDAGNRDSFFSLGLPLNEPDPVARLRAVHAATGVRKAEHDAKEMDELMQRLSALSPGLGRLCDRLEHSPRRFAVNVSNVPGPRGRMAVLNAPVRSMYSLAEIGEKHALRVSVVSLAGALYFGFVADPALVDGLDTLAAGVQSEAEALIAAG